MMNFKTRKPSCKASFPLVLLAGVEGAGKTWAAVESTAMPTVDRAFFIEVGESQADAYGAVPGADFEIIEHDGTVGQIRGAIEWAADQPADDGKFNLLIIDSLSEVWTLLSDNAQQEANRRAKRRGRNVPEDGVQITMDLWNRIKDTWGGLLYQCRQFPGPVLMTSRLELVTAMDANGHPTQDKYWKIKAEKNLPFQASVVMQARDPRRWTMTKIATTVPELQLQPGGEMRFKDFSVEKLLTTMGIGADAESSTYVQPQADGEFNDEKRAQEEEQQRRDEYVERQLSGLEKAEEAGDVGTLKKALDYYGRTSDQQLAGIARGMVARLEKAQAEQAQQAVQEELGGEVVEGELVTAE